MLVTEICGMTCTGSLNFNMNKFIMCLLFGPQLITYFSFPGECVVVTVFNLEIHQNAAPKR